MYYNGEKMVKKLTYGDKEVKAIYYQGKRIYPNIVDQQIGYDYDSWIYDLSKAMRSRKVTPWTRDVYGDGSLGEKVFGTATTQTETANVSTVYGQWAYTITTASCTRTRTVTIEYHFSDETKTSAQPNQTETGIRSVGAWTYNGVTNQRTATVTYVFSDETKTIQLTENGTLSYTLTIAFTGNATISAAGGSISVKPQATLQRKWNSEAAESFTPTVSILQFSGASNSFVISGINVAAPTRGTTLGATRSALIYTTTTMDGKTITSNLLTVSQEENTGTLSGSVTSNLPYGTFQFYLSGGTLYANFTFENLYGKYTSGAQSSLSISDLNYSVSANASWCEVQMESVSQLRCSVGRYGTSPDDGRSTSVRVNYTSKNSNFSGNIPISLKVDQYSAHW